MLGDFDRGGAGGDRQVHDRAGAPGRGCFRAGRPPPSWAIRPWTIDRPRPVPRPTSLVEKNGSTARASVSASMPTPVIDDRGCAYSRRAAARLARPASALAASTAIVSVPPSRHRVAGVDAQVEDGELELVGVGLGRRQSVRRVEPELDRRADRAGDQVAHAVDQRADVDRPALQFLPPREAEQALHQGLGALARLQRVVDPAVDARVLAAAACAAAGRARR